MPDEIWNGPGDDWYPGSDDDDTWGFVNLPDDWYPDDDEDAAYDRYREEVTHDDLGHVQGNEHGNEGREAAGHTEV